jgi:putative transposase
LCEQETQKQEIRTDRILGLDLGLTNFAVTSDGVANANPRHMNKKAKLLGRRQRQLAKKQKSSKRRERKKRQVSKLHFHVRMQRTDFLHQISRKIANSCDVVVVENLNVTGMMKNRRFSKSIGQTGWSSFVGFCSYKLAYQGGSVFQVNRFYPSSQLCSSCGNKQKMPLSARVYSCTKCGSEKDRDLNASLNLVKFYTTHGTWGSQAHGENNQSDGIPFGQVASAKCEKFSGAAMPPCEAATL